MRRADTTRRESDSVSPTARPLLWLVWAFPSGIEAVPVAHEQLIGRDSDCRFSLRGGGVSRRHVEIQRQGPIFALSDLNSTNGTFLNGKRVQHAAIAPGSVLRVGEHIGIFVESSCQPGGFREIASDMFGGHELAGSLNAALAAAPSKLPIVIVGATGTGKERVARAIHESSGRKGRFHAINCAALPPDLAEAELFGYRKGAFTGAERAATGHFRAADRGTLFLDELADLPLSLQAKLLRALEEGAVTPLGETDPVSIDVRVIAASQRPLTEFVAAKQFRADLHARLAGLTVALSALRERPLDVSYLFQHFIERYSGGRPPAVDSKLVECLCLYDWPGNVRELEQLARRLLAVHGSEAILKRPFLPPEILAGMPCPSEFSAACTSEFPQRRDHDLHQLISALKQVGGTVSTAANLVGISRQRAYRLLAGKSPAEWLAEAPDQPRLIAGDKP
ncbi:MAG: sigma 54-interacting transcriptional regulator [Polyangiaceae bacterium]